jgi:large subunit ribosomal protein L29
VTRRSTLSEFRTHEASELEFLLKEKRKRVFELRFKVASEEISDTKEVRRLRRDIARILTIQSERKRAADQSERKRAGETSDRKRAAPPARTET